MDVSSRHHLRSDAVRDIEEALAAGFGMEVSAEGAERVEFADSDWSVVLVDGEPVVTYFEGEPAPTVRGANAHPPTKRVVTVDAGAVSFVSDGADVMRPGIVEADEAIEAGDLVVVAEETHGKVLAVGRSRVAGAELTGDSGKVVDSLHHVGDELYGFSP
jgi:PUA domain protein